MIHKRRDQVMCVEAIVALAWLPGGDVVEKVKEKLGTLPDAKPGFFPC